MVSLFLCFRPDSGHRVKTVRLDPTVRLCTGVQQIEASGRPGVQPPLPLGPFLRSRPSNLQVQRRCRGAVRDRPTRPAPSDPRILHLYPLWEGLLGGNPLRPGAVTVPGCVAYFGRGLDRSAVRDEI